MHKISEKNKYHKTNYRIESIVLSFSNYKCDFFKPEFLSVAVCRFKE
jgi:hypothetical protein